jgi:hypothetical protein
MSCTRWTSRFPRLRAIVPPAIARQRLPSQPGQFALGFIQSSLQLIGPLALVFRTFVLSFRTLFGVFQRPLQIGRQRQQLALVPEAETASSTNPGLLNALDQRLRFEKSAFDRKSVKRVDHETAKPGVGGDEAERRERKAMMRMVQVEQAALLAVG